MRKDDPEWCRAVAEALKLSQGSNLIWSFALQSISYSSIVFFIRFDKGQNTRAWGGPVVG